MHQLNFQRWPCLQERGLVVFNTTADQRYLLGEKLFLKSHYPMVMRRFQNNDQIKTVTEKQLLEEVVLGGNNFIGNRVYILYGAAGAGKSELLRWMQLTIQHHCPERASTMVRINRNELDILSIVEKFQLLLSNQYFSEQTHTRWAEAKRKPRTISKLLLLSALEKAYDNDERINALYYRLLEWVHPRVLRALDMEHSEEANTPVELLTAQDIEELKSQSAFQIDLQYDQFRKHLTQTFQELLLEGNGLTDTLAKISCDLSQHRQRPLLLVDDLVQSLSIFSTDLLDYFTMLDSGNWDVVIGLTPDALSDNDHGRALLDRISYLDTFDDRVTKLFLSDSRGDESYFLNQDNCADFVAMYLDAFRQMNGVRCSTCHYFSNCKNTFSSDADPILAPFNRQVFRRLYLKLPNGKGKARQFLKSTRQMMEQLLRHHDLLAAMNELVRLDLVAESANPIISKLVEYYFPPVSEEQAISLDPLLLEALSFPNDLLKVTCQPLHNRIASETPITSSNDWVEDSIRVAISHWLEGKEVNRQSLIQFRKGIARWLREALPIGYFHGDHVSHPNKILRWIGVYLDTRPPILLEGVDEGIGVKVSRELGLLSILLNDYSLTFGSQKISLSRKIASDPRASQLLFSGYAFQAQLEEMLSNQLGMSPKDLATSLVVCLWHLGDAPALAQIPRIYQIPVAGQVSGQQVDIKLIEYTRMLFDDFFLLRENIYDSEAFLSQVISPISAIESIEVIDTNRLSEEFIIGDLRLSEFIRRFQHRILVWRNPLLSSDLQYVETLLVTSLEQSGHYGLPFSLIKDEVWKRFKLNHPEYYHRLRVYLE